MAIELVPYVHVPRAKKVLCDLGTPVLTTREAENERLFDKAVGQLYDCGFLHSKGNKPPEKIGPGAYSAMPGSIGWHGVSRELAGLLPGQIKPSTAHQPNGLSWQNGGNGPHGNIIAPGMVLKIAASQKIVHTLIPDAPNRYTLGALCRQLYAFVGPPEKLFRPKKGTTNTGAEVLRAGITFGYMHVEPGEYASAYHYDAKAYYYQMLCRLPSLRCIATRSGMIWPLMEPGEWERWKDVLSLIGDHKHLRNTMAGVAMGSYKDITVYGRRKASGIVERYTILGSGGPFRTAGLLLVRSGYEKTLEQRLTQPTLYARIDSVLTTEPRSKVWEKYGFSIKNDHSGHTEVCALGSYKVGDFSTIPYQQGSRVYSPLPGSTQPPAQLYSEWLH